MHRVRDASGICSHHRAVICPSGRFVSSPVCKNISVSTHPKSLLELRLSHPPRGAYRDRHGRGEGCGGRGSVLRATCSAQNQMTPRATSAVPLFWMPSTGKTRTTGISLSPNDPDMPKSTRLTHTAHHACVLAARGGASRPLPERKQERPRLSATKLKRPRAKWLRPRRRSGSLLRRRTRNRPTQDKPPASRFPTDRPSACWDCWLQGRP